MNSQIERLQARIIELENKPDTSIQMVNQNNSSLNKSSMQPQSSYYNKLEDQIKAITESNDSNQVQNIQKFNH